MVLQQTGVGGTRDYCATGGGGVGVRGRLFLSAPSADLFRINTRCMRPSRWAKTLLFIVLFLHSLLILLLATRFQPAGPAAAWRRLPSGGPFVGTAFGGLKKRKKSGSFIPSLLVLVLLRSTPLLPVLSSFHCLGRKKRGGLDKHLCCVPPPPSFPDSRLVTKWESLEACVGEQQWIRLRSDLLTFPVVPMWAI